MNRWLASVEFAQKGACRLPIPAFELSPILTFPSAFLQEIRGEELVKSRHSRLDGNPESMKPIEKTGFPFSRECQKTNLWTFYETIKR
jgi:hypothetical protein